MGEDNKALVWIASLVAAIIIVLTVAYNWRLYAIDKAHIEAGEEQVQRRLEGPSSVETVWEKRR
jgi:hypothetical protein